MITVNRCEVIRRGSRIVVKRHNWIDLNGLTRIGRTLFILDRATANKLFAMPPKLRADRLKVLTLKAQIKSIQSSIHKLERNNRVRGYYVNASKDGLKFGCTRVSQKKLDQIKKLLS